MHFDALTLACLTAELRTALPDGRVQQVIMTDAQRVGLEIYARQTRRYLLLSADRQASYACLVPEKLRRGLDAQPPLLLLLRKYVRGARLTAIDQPDPTERVLALRFDHPQAGSTTLIFEPMGRMANLLLTDATGRILDALHRVRPGEGRRPLMPGQQYAPPPPVDKLPPLDDGRNDYYAQLGRVLAEPGKLWRALLDGVAGVSPTQARELAWRAGGDATAPADAADLPALISALQALWLPVREGGWTPGIITDGDAVRGFAPYVLHFTGSFAATPTISQALYRYYAGSAPNNTDVATTTDAYAVQRAVVAKRITAAQEKLARQLAALAADEPAPGEADALRREAEWILALSSQIRPRQAELTVDLGDEEPLIIRLDPDKAPVEQAQRRFKRAAKLARAAEIIPRRRGQVEGDQAFLAQLSVDVKEAENQPEIAAVQRELDKLGLHKKKRPKVKGGGKPSGPRRYESETGFEILVGRNARQNDAVTFRYSRPEDIWLHVRNAPGAHVVIRRRGAEPDDATLEAAAQLAAYHSGLRGERAADVAVTHCRFVRRLPGGRPGQVTMRNEKTITVAAERPETVSGG
ncbi:MAG: NFACT family protein [Caldilineaceae bacterium]|nr:NFACT family protein [Caldilineaceae bacterium]